MLIQLCSSLFLNPVTVWELHSVPLLYLWDFGSELQTNFVKDCSLVPKDFEINFLSIVICYLYNRLWQISKLICYPHRYGLLIEI